MAKRTKAELKSGLTTYFPDNTSQDIDEADLRDSATDIVDSFRHEDDTTDNISEGTSNLYHTNARVLALAMARLNYFTVAPSGDIDLSSGTSSTITAAMVNKIVDFRGNSISANYTLNMADNIGVAGDIMLVINEASSTSGYTLTINGQLRFGSPIVLHHADAAIMFKTGNSTSWRVVAIWNVDTGIFGLADQTAADDGRILEWDNDNNRFILVDKPSGGGTALTAQGLIDLINNGEGNVDAALDTAGNKIALTGPTGGGGSFAFPTTALTTLDDMDEILVQDDTDDTLKAITIGNLRTVINSGPSGNPASHETVYGGHQTGTSFASWAVGDADVSQDVRRAGTTFRMEIPNVPNGDIYYFAFPSDRLPTMIVGALGANHVTQFTQINNAFTLGSTNFRVYYRTNNSGQAVSFPFTITTA